MDTIALYSDLPMPTVKVALDKGEWVILEYANGDRHAWHRHDDRYGGGRNGPPYLARCHTTECMDCPAVIPVEMQGFINLLKWER
jgi:hypothetical protein